MFTDCEAPKSYSFTTITSGDKDDNSVSTIFSFFYLPFSFLSSILYVLLDSLNYSHRSFIFCALFPSVFYILNCYPLPFSFFLSSFPFLLSFVSFLFLRVDGGVYKSWQGSLFKYDDLNNNPWLLLSSLTVNIRWKRCQTQIGFLLQRKIERQPRSIPFR